MAERPDDGAGAPRVVLHPDRPPGVPEAARALAAEGVIDLVDAASDDEVAAALRVPGSVYVGHRWREDFLADGLVWIQGLGVGVDQFPLEVLRDRGVVLCNARGVAAGCVAEHAFALLLALTRGLVTAVDDQRAHRWTQRLGAELAGSTLGVVGLGAIGLEVARRGRAFGMEVLGLRRRAGPVEGVDEVLGPDRLDELCARSSALVVCLPKAPETVGLIGAAQLAALGAGGADGGWLVNVGRGGVVDEAALVAALTDGRLRGAGLDVVDGEPLAPDSPLWDVPGLLLSGHSAALSPRWGEEWVTLFRHNLAAGRGEREWASRVP